MAEQAFPDGDLAHPDQPNAYGPAPSPQVKTGGYYAGDRDGDRHDKHDAAKGD